MGAGRPEKFETQMEMTRAILDQMEGLVRFHRPGTLEERGNLAAFLASDHASYLTGQIIDFDGGATLWRGVDPRDGAKWRSPKKGCIKGAAEKPQQ